MGKSCFADYLRTFQSTLPARGATYHKLRLAFRGGFQSTLPARGATGKALMDRVNSGISIHAPRTGSDVYNAQLLIIQAISIHAPRTGSDDMCPLVPVCKYLDFNPRSPHGERPNTPAVKLCPCYISIHAPRTGSDKDFLPNEYRELIISIHAPRTGSDAFARRTKIPYIYISIHAPRTGSDTMCAVKQSSLSNFNPRSPHGERQRHQGGA